MDYTARVTTQNNINIKVSIFILPLFQNTHDQTFNFAALITSQPTCADNVKAPNHILSLEYKASMKLSPPAIILYSTNIPADPSLWNDSFAATSLFSTNKFLQSNMRNRACSLQRMVSFLRQRNLKGHNRNNISQLNHFGESVQSLVFTIFKLGQDLLNASRNTSFHDMVVSQFVESKASQINSNNPNSSSIKKVLPPILLCLTKNQLENTKNCQARRTPRGNTAFPSSKLFAQVTALVANILKIVTNFI